MVYDPNNVSLSGAWGIDDQGTINLNGNQIGSLGGGAWGALTSVSVPTGSADFVTGLNTLSITMTSDDHFLEAVRFEGSVTGTGLDATAPEPGSVLLMLAGLGSLAFAKRRRA